MVQFRGFLLRKKKHISPQDPGNDSDLKMEESFNVSAYCTIIGFRPNIDTNDHGCSLDLAKP